MKGTKGGFKKSLLTQKRCRDRKVLLMLLTGFPTSYFTILSLFEGVCCQNTYFFLGIFFFWLVSKVLLLGVTDSDPGMFSHDANTGAPE